MSVHGFVSMAGLIVVCSAPLFMLPGLRRASFTTGILVVASVGLLLFVPMGGLPPGGYVRGITGDFSVTSVCMALAFIGSGGGVGPDLSRRDRSALWILVALLALALYPMTLGLTLADPYRLGYGDPWFVGALLVVAGGAWMRGLVRVPLVIALAVLAWVADLQESTNLWDYLLDVFVALYALARVFLMVLRRVRAAYRARPTEAA